MRVFVLLIALVLEGCVNAPPKPETITITKTVPVYPPANLYDDSGCVHAAQPDGGTVGDLVSGLIGERAHLDDCRADRAALQTWANGVGANDPAK